MRTRVYVCRGSEIKREFKDLDTPVAPVTLKVFCLGALSRMSLVLERSILAPCLTFTVRLLHAVIVFVKYE